MRAAKCLAVLYAVSNLHSAPAAAQEVGAVRVEYGTFSYESVDVDRLRFRVQLRLAARRDNLILSSIRFDEVSVNGLPIVVEPYEGTVELVKDHPVPLPRFLEFSIYFREIDSLDPLRTLLAKESVTLKGRAQLGLKTKGVLKVLTLGRKLRRNVELDQEVPVQLLDNPLARIVADQLMNELADPNSLVGTRWLEQRLELQALIRRGDALSSSLVRMKTSYQMQHPESNDLETIESLGMGFFIEPERALVTKRSLEPWKFDPEMAFWLQRGFEVQDSERTLILSPAGPGAAKGQGSSDRRLTAREFEIQENPSDEWVNRLQSIGDEERQVLVHRQSTPQALALLKVRQSSQRPPVTSRDSPNSGEFLVGITYFKDIEDSEQPRPHTEWALATPEAEGLTLDRQFPEIAAGAPVFDENGEVRGVFMEGTFCLPIEVYLELNRL